MTMKSMVVVYPTCNEYFQSNGASTRTRKLHVLLGLVSILKGPFTHLPGPFLNGLGGKVMRGESLTDAARRESREECGKTPRRASLFYCGYVVVRMFRKEAIKLHVFRWRCQGFPEFKPGREHDRFDWYHVDGRDMKTTTMLRGREVSATILPSDKHWLMEFLYSTEPRAKEIRVRRDFSMQARVGMSHAKSIPYKKPRML